jgi:PST family polysaccharide transporter
MSATLLSPPAAAPTRDEPSAPVEVVARTGRAIGWTAIQQIAVNGITFASYVVMARLLKPGDFGLLAYATVFIALMQAFIDQGLPDAVVQRGKLKESHLDTAFWFNLGLSSAMAGVLWLAAPGIGAILHEPRLGPILQALGLVLPFSALGGIHQALLKRRLEYGLISVQTLATYTAGSAMAVAMALHGWGVWSLVGQQLAAGLGSSLCAIVFSRWMPRPVFHFSELRELWGYSLNITSAALLDFFNRRANDFLIGFFLGTTALGIYNLATRLLVTFTRLITYPLNSVAFSALSRLQKDEAERRKLFYQLTQVAAAVSVPLFLGLAAVAPDFLGALFGARWVESAAVLRILCLIGILHSVVLLHGTLLRAAGRPGWQTLFTLGGAMTNLVGFLALVKLGLLSVAGWYVGSAYLWLAVDLELVRRVLAHRTSDYLRGFFTPILYGVTVAGGMFGLQLLLTGRLNVYERLGCEFLIGTFLFLFFYRSYLLNPRQALAQAGIIPRNA